MHYNKYKAYSEFLQEDLFIYAEKRLDIKYANMLRGIFDRNELEFCKKNMTKQTIDTRRIEGFMENKILELVIDCYLTEKYAETGHVLEKAGCEGTKVFISEKYSSSEPDYIWRGNLVEMQQDTFGNSEKGGRVWTRLSKVPNLKKIAKEHDKKVYLLIVDIKHKCTYSLIIDENTPVNREEDIEWFGGKHGHWLPLEMFTKKSLN